jgi:mRNA-degrading endonuclease toxin of MazEF toxin-antitoxin module
MPRFERWDIVAVPFPYVERPVEQRRPALVVASTPGAAHRLIWVLMITAAANQRWPDDVAIDDHGGAGLPIPSVVRTAKIATVEVDAAARVGAISERNAAEILAILEQRLL